MFTGLHKELKKFEQKTLVKRISTVPEFFILFHAPEQLLVTEKNTNKAKGKCIDT